MKTAGHWAKVLSEVPISPGTFENYEKIVGQIQLDAASCGSWTELNRDKPKPDSATENMRQRVWLAAYEAALNGGEFQKTFAPTAAQAAVALFDAAFNLPTSIFHKS